MTAGILPIGIAPYDLQRPKQTEIRCLFQAHFLRILINGPGASAALRSPAAGEVVEERAGQFPRVKFLNRGFRVGQSATGKAHEVERAAIAMTTRRTADIEISVVGQGSVRPKAGAKRVQFAVEIEGECCRLAVGFGNDVVPLTVIDGGTARETRGAAL